ncbi:Leishmanolysin-like peptidase [Glycine soja]
MICPLSVRPFQRSERGTNLSHLHRHANDFKAPLALSQPRHAPTPHSLSTQIRVLASHFEHCSFISLESKSLFVTPFSASSNVQNASQPEILARSEADRKFAGELMESESVRFFMELTVRCPSCALSRFHCKLRFAVIVFEIILILAWVEAHNAKSHEHQLQLGGLERNTENIASHSCIHDQILEQRKRPGRKVYSITPQVYEPGRLKPPQHKGRTLLDVSTSSRPPEDAKKPIRIYLNYDAVGHSPDRDCRAIGDIVKLGEPPMTSPGFPSCDPHAIPPIFGDCWYNCTSEDISEDDKKCRLRKALGQTADWFRRALAVEPVKGNLRLSGYSACGQDGGVQLPRGYIEEGVSDADLVLLVTTRPTTGNTLAWAVACERDQWGRAIAGHVNVAPRHLTAEAETLLSATLIHEVMHVLGFDPHAFAHFRDERKRRRNQVTEQVMDEKLGRMATRVVLPRVVMHSRYHYAAFSGNFSGLELEDGGGRGTSGSHWEKRLLMNEIMTGSVDTRSVVSKMTLALLEDSGWYKANYSMADHLDWGRNQGTEFVTSPCNLWEGAYRCNTTQFSGCTYNREAEGYCPILTYSGDLPRWARYFPQANKGGQSSLADYCTYFVAYSDGSCTDTNSARAPDRMLGEVRGSNSRCMASSLVRTGFVRGSMTQGNGCYQHRHSSDGDFTVKSAYHQATHPQGWVPPISSEIPRDMWKKFWKIKSIPKCLNLSWRACKSVLPVMKNLPSRGLEVDIRCPCCGEREETVMHALLLCEEVNQIWFASHLGGRVLINDDVPFVIWFYDCIICELLWTIWYMRNQWVFQKNRIPVVLLKAQALVAVDGIWKVCPQAGGPIQFPGFNGELLCPAYHELCNTDPVAVSGQCPNSCNFNGDCVDGKCRCFLGFHGNDCSRRSCPSKCNGNGMCLSNGICECKPGYTGIDCSTAVCDEQCSLHGGVCDNGVCEFRCSDYAGYTCQNSSMLLSSLSVCKNVLGNDVSGQHCAPSEPSILQQLEEVVVIPNYHRLFPGGARKLFNIFGSSYCDETAKRLACWISIQKCDKDGDNRLRVCHSACQSYNLACGASLDCSDQTLFSSDGEGEGQCTGSGEMKLSWFNRLRSSFSLRNSSLKGISVKYRQL